MKIYVQFSDCGQHIRKWDFEPFEGGLGMAFPDEGPWRCFHCGDYFTDRAAARLHFGPEIDSAPACLIKGSEGGLLKAFSTAEQAATDYMVKLHEEDGQLIRAFRDQASRVREAVQSAEETGFQRGVDQCFDPIRALLATVDAADKDCPYKQTPHPSSEEKCHKCRAERGDGCFPATTAAHDFVRAVRELIEGKPE